MHHYLSEPLDIQKVVTIRGLSICELGLIKHFCSLYMNEQISVSEFCLLTQHRICENIRAIVRVQQVDAIAEAHNRLQPWSDVTFHHDDQFSSQP